METVGHIAASAIIYRVKNPAQIFTDIKDATYPHVVWRGCLCFIGGNWTGKGAMYDVGPMETFAREITEELSLEKSVQSTAELGETSVHTDVINYRVKGLKREATAEDYADLEFVKQAIFRAARSFDDYVVTIPRDVFLRGDPETKQTDMTALLSIVDVGLDEQTWRKLARLQRELGNLSCESETHVLSVGDIVHRDILAMSGYDQILQEFFEVRGCSEGHTLPRDNAVTVKRAPLHPRLTYKEYLKHYSVTRKPEGW